MRMTFQRRSTATLRSNGQPMRTGLPRYEPGLLPNTRCLLIEGSSANLLTANQSSVETDLTGFLVVNAATLIRTGAVQFEGGFALRVDSGTAASAGVDIRVTTSTQGNYVGQCRVRSPVSPDIHVWLRVLYTDATFDESPHVAVPQGITWPEIITDFVSTNGAKVVSAVILYVRRAAGTADVTFYVDAMQIEPRAYATSWQMGGPSRQGEQLTLPAYALINNEESTIEGWFYLTSAFGQSRYIVDARQRPENSSITDRWYLRILNTAVLEFGYWVGISTRLIQSPPLARYIWTHFAVKWHRGGSALFINGAQVSGHIDRPILLKPLPRIHIGTSALLADHLNGMLSMVRFTRRARSDGEILAGHSLVVVFDPDAYFESPDTRPDTRVFSLDGTLSSRPGAQNLYVPDTDFVSPTTVTASTTATNYAASYVNDYEFPLRSHRTTTENQSTLTFDFSAGVNIAAVWMGLLNYLGAYVEYGWDNATWTALPLSGVLCPRDEEGDGYRKGWQPLFFAARYVRLTLPEQQLDDGSTYFETPLVLFAAETTGLSANRNWGTQFSIQYDVERADAGGHMEVQVRGERTVQLQVRGVLHHGEAEEWLDLIRLGPHHKFLWCNNLGKPEASYLFYQESQASWEEQYNPIVTVTFKEHIN